MRADKEKEFWLEPKSSDLAEEEVRELAKRVRPDVLLVEKSIDLGTKIASKHPGADILVTKCLGDVLTAKNVGSKTAFEVVVRNRSDHGKVLEALRAEPDYVIVDCPEWRIIPLENLVADRSGVSKLLARTHNYEESKTALGVLEIGVDGILLSSNNFDEIEKTRALVSNSNSKNNSQPQIFLSTAKVESVRPIKTGARVCVDTTEIISSGEGLLVGCSSQALFLVEGEVHANPHVNPRPFRVNAGPVSLYVLTSDKKTRYLSELEAGETVVLVDKNGTFRDVDVARVKVERRPMILVEARIDDKRVKTIVQNAETVRLLGPKGSTPVNMLKPSDEVYVRLEEGGRHFGSRVEHEMIIER